VHALAACEVCELGEKESAGALTDAAIGEGDKVVASGQAGAVLFEIDAMGEKGGDFSAVEADLLVVHFEKW
jgi:hypothetical protein